MTKSLKFKQGAASFYIVAFSTLILLIIAASFATVIISEITRTSNADLSQSAYDSAMAGIEDAKLAIYNYEACIAKGATAEEPKDDQLSCENIVWYMENGDCDMVAHILGRIGFGESEEVIIEESSSGSNNMQQAYTCNKINLTLADYRSTLSSSKPIEVFKAKFNDGTSANEVKYIRINWYGNEKSTDYAFTNFSGNEVVFPLTKDLRPATPPTISIAMIQTAATFSLDSFNTTIGEETNRGMLYLVPTDDETAASNPVEDNHKAGYNGTENHIEIEGFLSSNDKLGGANKNLPYAVYCPENSGNNFACSALIDLPAPIGGTRSDDTFVFIVALPYGKPDTDFSIDFFCDGPCGEVEQPTQDQSGDDTSKDTIEENRAILKGVQIGVDSTGRANNLYRRVQARLESGANDYPLSIMGPLELLGKGDVLKKDYSVTTEHNFTEYNF
ncbi:hypothetical protein IKF67_02335 [Candidatus Saccharibacteria bacterium]|nr:hypothetical protein [Candidatus Saccharibacteria bacterium]